MTEPQHPEEDMIPTMLETVINGKPVAGVLRYWAIHDLSVLPEAWHQKRLVMYPGTVPWIVTACLDEDLRRRWPNDRAMKTSLLVGLDLQHMMIETVNSIYFLVGRGRVSREPPLDYAWEVGKTIMILAGYEVGDDGIFHLDLPKH